MAAKAPESAGLAAVPLLLLPFLKSDRAGREDE
jgi:hypothetical protein